jgi:hypothetical protein
VGALDIGADERSAAPVVARMLTKNDVGPGLGGPPPEPVQPPIDFEAENLAHIESGGTYTLSFEDTASGGQFASPHITNPADPLYPVRHRFVTFNGDGVPPPPDGEWIEFTLPDVPRGTYNLVLRYKSHPTNRAVMRLFVDGVPLGATLNQLTSATFKTNDFGVVRFDLPGSHIVRLAVVGKTNTSGPWNLTADVFSLVPDSKRPVIVTPLPDLALEATGPAGATATYSASATDNKDGTVPVVFTPPSGSLFPLGTTTVTATATDFHGNVATATFAVRVFDTTPPALSVPADVVAEATGPEGAAVTLSASATDIVDGTVPVVFDPASGSVFPLGTTTVTATATDAAGNSSEGTFTVTVRDTTPPVLDSQTVTPHEIWPPNHKMVPVVVGVRVRDAVDGTPDTRIVSVTSNEPTDGTDWEVTGPLTLNLRADRAGSGTGRVYTIVVASIDDFGNASTVSLYVVVPHDRGR